MKVTAKQILKKALKYNIKDELDKLPGRANKLSELKESALEFTDLILSNFDFPSTITTKVGNMRGFNDITKDLGDVVGVININASFKSLSGVTFRMTLPIPVSSGMFYKPSVAIINGKKYVFSQGLIDRLVAKVELTKPQVSNYLLSSPEINRVEEVLKPMFSSPEATLPFLEDVLNRMI
jgi:hypothetical protein